MSKGKETNKASKNTFEMETPPKPITHEEYQIYLIGMHIEERNAFVPINTLWPGLFETYRKAKLFLDGHSEIRKRKPSPQRLEVHAGDWFRCLAARVGKSDPTDKEIKAYLEGCKQRKAEIERRKRDQ